MSKELYIEAYEELVAELIDDGHSEAEAERIAESGAYDRMVDGLADRADMLADYMDGLAADRWLERECGE